MSPKRALAAFLLLGLASSASPLRAATLREADRKFEQGLYQEALGEYELLLKGGPEERRLKALYRACESEALLFRYGKAFERLRKAQPPSDPLWRARLLVLETELTREFLKQYGQAEAARRDVVEGEKEVFRKTPKQLHARAAGAYWELRRLRKTLLRRGIGDEAYFVDVAKADRGLYPTLFDFVVHRWQGYLLSEMPEPEGVPRPKAISFVKQGYGRKPAKDLPPAALAGALMEEAYRVKGSGRDQARGLWRIRRLLLPFRYSHRVRSFKKRDDARGAAAAILRKWMRELRSGEAQAMAGFEAASLKRDMGKLPEAVDICEEVQRVWKESLGALKCGRLSAGIKTPTLELRARVTPPSGKEALTVTTKNVEEVYLRLYRTIPQELRDLQERGRSWTWSGVLNHVRPDVIKGFLAGHRADRSWSVRPEPKTPYSRTQTKIDLPDPKPGLYLAVVSGDPAFEPGESLLYGAVLNVTDLVLVGTYGLEGLDRDLIYRPGDPDRRRTLPAFHYYLLEGTSGRPARGADIHLRAYRQGEWQSEHLRTGELGRAQSSVTVNLRPRNHHGFNVDPLAGSGGHWAYWAGSAYAHFRVPPRLQLFMESDRPIYRPGQKARYKVTVVERIPQGFKTYGDTGRRVVVRAHDANGVEFAERRHKLRAGGSVSGELLIPTGRLLGNYTLRAEVSDGRETYRGSVSLAVEEYKRPEFEVTLKEAEGAWRFGKDAKVSGSVKYYFGGPVPDAPVVYKVTRETYRPWFCWWWAWRSAGGRTEVLRAETKTDKEGAFSFTFTPQPADQHAADPMPARFTVEIEARDPGGRTIKTQKSYVAGRKAYLFQITPSGGFARTGKRFKVDAKLVNLNERPVRGEGRFALHRLEGDPEIVDQGPTWGGSFPRSPPLERIYKDVPDGEKVQEGELVFGKKKPTALDLKPLEPGAYRLTLKAEDPWDGKVEQSIILLVVDPKGSRVPLKIQSLSIPEHSEYAVGESALLLIGSAELDAEALTHVEIWGGRHLLERRAVDGGGIRALSLPLSVEHKGGVTVRWFGIKDFKPRAGSLTLRVPWKEKELYATLKYKKVLKPGEKATWSVWVGDTKGRKVSGEAVARMYDRSLEYYAKGGEARPETLYSARQRPDSARGSLHWLRTTMIRIEKGWIKKLLEAFRQSIEEPLAPALRLNRSRVRGRYGRRYRTGALLGLGEKMDFEADMAMPSEVPMSPMAPMKKGKAREEKEARSDKAGGKAPAPPPPVKIRKDFSETAFFKPHVRVSKGRGSWSFTAPEQLTSWRVSGHVMTRDVKVGRFSEEAVTRKELMVRVEMPRFFREGDEGTLKAVVHNESEADMSGSLTLSVLEDGRPAAHRLGLSDLEKGFVVKPHGLTALSWKIKVPSGVATFKVRAVARSGEKVDAEERELPILPSRQRLIDSLVVALNGDVDKELTLKALMEKDESRQSELLQLQVDPQLALTVLNSLPFLVQYPYECVEQTLNRYVPMAVVNKIYERHPAIAAAAAKIPKRDTITPAWDGDDPKRLMTLMETPWLQISKGRKSHWPVIDMFDPKVVAHHEKDALGKLKAAQLSSGGFPWFPGGREDPYMTLYVLAGLSEAKHYGVKVPEDMIKKALRYVMNEIPRHLRPREQDVSLILYAAYVVTSFPDQLQGKVPQLRKGRTVARAWLDYADKHAGAMTRLGKAYAAYAYWRLGDKKKGDLYLKRAMDAAREDPVAGVYWTPEKYSWLWYNDTLETHAFVLRTLQTLRPNDRRIPGMVQWLIFNRKGTEWKSTKASAAAIFTLLDFLKKRGALDRGDTYTVSWGDVRDEKRVGPADWLAKPLRWTKRGADITHAHSRPKVAKKGPGLAFASLTYVYTTRKLADASEPGMMNVRRKFYRRVKKGKDYHLVPLKRGAQVSVGDEIEVQLKINTRSKFEYVHLKDPRGAGFEAETLRSGWKWDQLGRYEEPRDSLTNFFVSWLPHGEYILRYRVRPTTAGKYRIGAAVIQSMYSPEFAAHSSGFELKVVE